MHKKIRYTYIDKKNEGPSIARNTAIAASSGKYILPLDADDLIAPTYTEKAINHLKTHPKTKLVYCLAEFFGDEQGMWELRDYKYEDLLWENKICTCLVFQ